MNDEYKKRIQSEEDAMVVLDDPLTPEERKRVGKMSSEEYDDFYYNVLLPRLREKKLKS